MYFIFSHCGLGSPLGVRGKGREKRKNEMHPEKRYKNQRISSILMYPVWKWKFVFFKISLTFSFCISIILAILVISKYLLHTLFMHLPNKPLNLGSTSLIYQITVVRLPFRPFIIDIGSHHFLDFFRIFGLTKYPT